VLDHCLQLIKEKDEVDIFSIVYSLRKERVLMVQTEVRFYMEKKIIISIVNCDLICMCLEEDAFGADRARYMFI
jgi:protein tyrosine phosphatase